MVDGLFIGILWTVIGNILLMIKIEIAVEKLKNYGDFWSVAHQARSKWSIPIVISPYHFVLTYRY